MFLLTLLFVSYFQVVHLTLTENITEYFHVLTRNFEKDFKHEKLNNYRIGDIFKHSGNTHNEVCKKWPKSLGCKYVKNTTEPCRFDKFINILNGYDHKHHHLRKDVMVVHVRTGDGLVHRKNNLGDCWNKQDDCHKNFSYTNHYYNKYLKNINGIKTVVIVSNPLHYTRARDERDKTFTEDMRYLQSLTDFFNRKWSEIKIFYKLPGHPDEDLHFLSNARHFVIGGGGYSSLAATNVQLTGGKIYGILHPVFCIKKLKS